MGSPADVACPTCPKCGALLRLKSGSRGTFWSCSKYPDCAFTADDVEGQPLLKQCPECHSYLRYGVNAIGPFTACYVKEKHADGQIHFFDNEGNPQQGLPPLPEAKGTFTCPECRNNLKYFRVKKGPNKGHMCFGCFESEKHSDNQPHFFADKGGAPVF